MYCPKCATQNADGTKFCRGCGADIGNVMAVVEGKPPQVTALAERYIERNSRAVRGLLGGLGFLIVAAVSYGITEKPAVFVFFSLIFAFVFLATGVSRMVEAKGLKALSRISENADPDHALSAGQTEYIKPSRSIYETDELTREPASITERTTTHLKPPENS